MLHTFLRKHVLSLSLTAVVIVLSLFPFGRIELAEGVPLADKWTHMVMYGTLSLALAWEYSHSGKPLTWPRYLLIVLLYPILLGGLLELAQAYCTNYRSGEWLDLVADTIGAAVAAAIAAVCFKNRRNVIP